MRRTDCPRGKTDGGKRHQSSRSLLLSVSSRNHARMARGIHKHVTRRSVARCTSVPPHYPSAEKNTVTRTRDVSHRTLAASVPSAAKESSAASPLKADMNTALESVVLQGTIPDVLEWTRRIMDERKVFCGHHEANDTVVSAREFARELHSMYKFRIITNDGAYWKSEVRLWENICALSSRLPIEGEARIIFEAMRRYPSSVLVHYGLKIVFGRQMVIGSRRVRRLPISRNALALFSPSVNNKKSLKEWFERETHVRVQETVIHMCAASEYILRCAYIAKQKNDPSALLLLIEERIQIGYDDQKRRTLELQPWNILKDLSEDNASACLEGAMTIAHNAVIDGARAACKRYGRKSTLGKEREKIKLEMLRKPLKDVMDRVIHGIEEFVKTVIGIQVDSDFFRVHATRALRKVCSIYEDVGNTKFETETDVPHDTKAADPAFSAPYVFTPLS